MKGFTLIELTVALSIMTILVAVMLPRFVQLQRSVRISNLRALHGSVNATSTFIHASLQLRAGQPDSAPCLGGAIADNRLTGLGTVCSSAGLLRTRRLPRQHARARPARLASGAGPAFKPEPTQLLAMVPGGAASVTTLPAPTRTPDTCIFP